MIKKKIMNGDRSFLMIMRKIIYYVRYFLDKLKEDAVSAYAAQAAFFIIMSAFPFIMLILTLVQYLPLTPEMLIDVTETIIPSAFSDYVVSLIEEIYEQSSVTIISITFLSAVWASSKSFLAIIRGCNSIYDIRETRNYVKLRLIASVYTIIFAVVLVVTLTVMVFGNKIVVALMKAFPIPILQEIALLIISFRTTIAFGIMFVFFLILYLVVPNRKGKLLGEIPGAVMTSVGWIGFSYLYSFYIDNFADFDTYGSLTTIVFMMLWLYACMYMFFIGGEINVLLQKVGGIWSLIGNIRRKKE